MLAIISNNFIVLHPDVLSFDPSLNENLNLTYYMLYLRSKNRQTPVVVYFLKKEIWFESLHVFNK